VTQGTRSRILNPLHVLGNTISVSHIDGLKIFKLYEHPAIWKETIEGKKGARLARMKAVRIFKKTQVIGASQTVHRYKSRHGVVSLPASKYCMFTYKDTGCVCALSKEAGCVCA
jgi:hypothetical protein